MLQSPARTYHWELVPIVRQVPEGGDVSAAEAIVIPFRRKKTDLMIEPRPALLSNAGVPEPLQKLFQQVDDQATKAIDWYYWRRRKPAIAARIVRIGAIVFTSAGGLVPVVQSLIPIPSSAGYVLLALAAALIAFDRFGGFSSAWMRYIATAQKLTTEQTRFRLDWAELTASSVHGPMTADGLGKLFTRVRLFADTLNSLIESETQVWVGEFQSALAALDRLSTRPKTEPEQLPVATTTSVPATKARLSVAMPEGIAGSRKYFVRLPASRPLRAYGVLAPERGDEYVSRVIPNLMIASLTPAQIEDLRQTGAEVIPSRKYAPVLDPLERVYAPLSEHDKSLRDVLEHINAPKAWKKHRG